MNHPKALRSLALALCALFPALSPSFGLVVPESGGRFSALELADPSTQAGPAPLALRALEAADLAARPWGQFLQAHGNGWEIYLDARSGAPLLVQGQGIPWIPGPGNTLAGAALGPGAAAGAPAVTADSDAAQGDGFGLAPAVAGPVTLEGLASSLLTFVARNRSAFLADEAELVLSREGSGSLTDGLWRVGFDRQVGGIPVTGDRLVFYIGQGNLIAFGATRWSRVTTGPDPALGAAEARARLYKYLGLGGAEPVELVEPGSLAFTPLAAPGSGSLDYSGPVGAGYATALTWRIALRVGGGSETWVGLVDARTGAVLAFYDDNKYAQVKGGMLPITSDGQCPDGCEQPGFSMPFANLTIGGSPVSSNFSGIFSCSPAGTAATTSLSGPYVRVSDACGAISQSITCDADLDLGTSAGTDCTVPAGSSAGNTHAARTGFYHLNRIKEHARAWLPSNTWLKQQLTDNVNINNSCNGFWNGSTVNFYRSGSSCRNTGEIAAIFLHEWGHGMDNYDGGGYDNPSEAYADVAAYLMTHSSCIGRGFRKTGTCGGYGNPCLTCSGVREADWNLRANHAPSTPEGFIATCPSGGSSGGPCGKEVHCEGYLISETLWDLATRDLPASGLDQTTSWALLDRIWFLSRTGSGGNMYGCGTPASNRSCAASSWFTELRAADDDDGNLANGTPHAGAIFAAFNRHNIPCGAASDASNQSVSSCPSLAATVLTGSPGPGTASLSWSAVAGASSYAVLRNDIGCGWGFTLAGSSSGLTFDDSGLPNGVPEYYAVQAVGANAACRGTVSNCVAVSPMGNAADLVLSKTDSPHTVTAGQNVTYTLTLRNQGMLPADNVQLSDPTPAGTTFQSLTAAAGWVCSAPSAGASGTVACTAPTLAVGGVASFTIVVRTGLCLAGGSTLTNTATATTTSVDQNSTNNVATVTTNVSSAGCDDGNTCTTDTCDPVTGCAHATRDCSDGNPCTNDFCSTSTGCLHTTVICADTNACTVDSCSPATGCTHAPLDCSDGNPCTTDSCSPATGCSHVNTTGPCDDANSCTVGDACLNGLCSGSPPPPPAEVNDSVRLALSGATATISWSDGSGTFNVYRGSRSPVAPWDYNQECINTFVPGPSTDATVPPAAATFYYLVTRRTACGESIPGRSSAGALIPNPSPCP